MSILLRNLKADLFFLIIHLSKAGLLLFMVTEGTSFLTQKVYEIAD